jgi:C-terminal processing protease CtpA/Prc
MDILKNTSAEKEEMVIGDLVEKINDQKISSMSYKNFVLFLDVPEGTSIKLLIKKMNGDE